MKLSSHRLASLQNRRTVIIIAAIIVVLAMLSGYVLWSMNQWANNKAAYVQWHQQLKTTTDSTFKMPVVTEQDRAQKLAELKKISSSIDAAKTSLCQPNTLVQWQTLITSLRKQRESCEKMVASATVLGQKTKEAVAYFEGDQALAKIINDTLTSTKDKTNESAWGAQPSAWQAAGKRIKDTSVSKPLEVVKNDLIAATQAIEASWGSVLAGHTAKDKAKFIEAQASLLPTYEALKGASKRAAEQSEAVVKDLQSVYDNTF